MRRVLRLTERSIDKHGQVLLEPELTLEGWTTSLPARIQPAQVIALYADHGTHEQFHSEFKTDLDLTRLPSGKFDTNYLVCQLAALTMNILRLIGQAGLTGPDAPVRHPAKRRRLKTVLQELIYRAGRLIEHGRPPNSCAGTTSSTTTAASATSVPQSAMTGVTSPSWPPATRCIKRPEPAIQHAGQAAHATGRLSAPSPSTRSATRLSPSI